MKLIIVDFLRRRAWLYLLGIFFFGFVDWLWMVNGRDAHGSFIFGGLFMLALLLEQKQGCPGVVTTLPVSRRTTARYYWGVAVLLPVLAIAVTFVLAGLLSFLLFSGPPLAILARSFAAVVLTSLIWAGAGGCLFTFWPPLAREDVGYFMPAWMLLWAAALVFGVFIPDRFDLTKQGPAVWGGAALLGIVLSGVAYARREKLVLGRASRRFRKTRLAGLVSGRIPGPNPMMARFGGMFFKEIGSGLQIGILYPVTMLAYTAVFKRPSDESDALGILLLATSATEPAGIIMSGGLRSLRMLPSSTARLALILLLMPLSRTTVMFAGFGLMQGLNLGHVLNNHPLSFLIPLAGVVGIGSSLSIRFGWYAFPALVVFGAPISVLIYEAVPIVRWPAGVWWFLGAGLMVAAFFLNRYWLRASASYRAPSGDIIGRRI